MSIDPSTAFVSYSRDDLEFVLRLAKDLKAKGAKVWMDKLDIRPGQRWEAEIEAAVDGSSRMLVILSPAAIASNNVLAEAGLAIDEGKEIIPVLYQECRIPFRLRPIQIADFRADYAFGLEELLASLGVTSQAAPNTTATEAQELGRLQQEDRRRESWQRAAEGAQGSSDYGGWLRAAEHAAARELEEERKRLEEVEASRVAAESEARLAKIAEEAKLELKEQQRKQKQAEAQRLAAETKRKAEEERARQAELERQRIAVEQERQPIEQEKTQSLSPNRETAPPKFPLWAKGGAAVLAILVVGWLIYLASSGSQPKQPAGEPQKQQAKSETPDPAITAQPASSYPQAPPPGTEATPTAGMSAKVADLYRKAQAGDSGAMVDLGLAYETGKGVNKDYQQALAWYRKAAKVADAHGMYKLGTMYENGLGVPRDYQQAINWYRKAAEAGDTHGMYELAAMDENGLGVPRDYQQAVNWYRKAADGGDADAMAGLGGMYYNGYGVENNYTQAVSWFRKAADARNATAMNYLGACYETGQGVNMDREQAVTWYRKAAQLGNEKAKRNLERLGENP